MSKSGGQAEHLLESAAGIAALENITLKGLMTIEPYEPDPEDSRPYFKKMRTLFEQLRGAAEGIDTLSMGMSHNYKVAADEGATIVRVGTSIFGPRG